MTNNKLTDEALTEFTEKLDSCGTYPDLVLALRELLQRREADKNCLLYGIVDCDGNAYIDECCVALAASQLDAVIDELNTEYEDGEYANDGAPYRVAALYTALPLTDSEREELQEYRKAKPIGEVVRIGPALLADFYGSVMQGDKLYSAPQLLTDNARAELQEYRKAATADHETLKRLAVILSGSDAPGEMTALTVTALSFVNRCKQLSKELNTLRSAAGNSHEPSDR